MTVVGAVDFAIVEWRTATDVAILGTAVGKVDGWLWFYCCNIQRRLIGCQEWCKISSFQQIPQSDTIVRCSVQHHAAIV